MTVNRSGRARASCSACNSWNWWLCHGCGVVQKGGACIKKCNWSTHGWTCLGKNHEAEQTEYGSLQEYMKPQSAPVSPQREQRPQPDRLRSRSPRRPGSSKSAACERDFKDKTDLSPVVF